MAELPVLKYKGGIGISFTTEGRVEGMLMRPDLYGMTSIPDNMEVVVRRAGDCVEVVTRPRVTPDALTAAAPDLLAALQEVAELQGSAHAPAGSLWSRVNAAIAKAIGEPDARQAEIARARALYDKCDKP